AGKSAFSLPFGKGAARQLVAATTVLGAAPASPRDWAYAQEALSWRAEARKAIARWTSLAGEFGLEVFGDDVEAGFRRIAQWEVHIEEVRRLVFEFDANLHTRLAEVFGKATADRMWDGG